MSSDENSHRFEKMAKDLKLYLRVLLSSQKWPGRKYTSLVCVTRRMVQAYLSRVMRKPTFCICKNKDADQLRGNREADQRLCFRYTDSTIPLLTKYEI